MILLAPQLLTWFRVRTQYVLIWPRRHRLSAQLRLTGVVTRSNMVMEVGHQGFMYLICFTLIWSSGTLWLLTHLLLLFSGAHWYPVWICLWFAKFLSRILCLNFKSLVLFFGAAAAPINLGIWPSLIVLLMGSLVLVSRACLLYPNYLREGSHLGHFPIVWKEREMVGVFWSLARFWTHVLCTVHLCHHSMLFCLFFIKKKLTWEFS